MLLKNLKPSQMVRFGSRFVSSIPSTYPASFISLKTSSSSLLSSSYSAHTTLPIASQTTLSNQSTSKMITPLQLNILKEYQNAFIIPEDKAKVLENVNTNIDGTLNGSIEGFRMDSVLRKRRLKMKKHKLRKRRKAQKALRRKLKK